MMHLLLPSPFFTWEDASPPTAGSISDTLAYHSLCSVFSTEAHSVCRSSWSLTSTISMHHRTEHAYVAVCYSESEIREEAARCAFCLLPTVPLWSSGRGGGGGGEQRRKEWVMLVRLSWKQLPGFTAWIMMMMMMMIMIGLVLNEVMLCHLVTVEILI